MYGGAQGIWVDKARTANLTEDGNGVTVGLLHTGRSYPDELSDDGVIYHYPCTTRGARDGNEIKATKSARDLGLPVFVITHSSPGSSLRDVHLSWVEDWDDAYAAFLVAFADQPSLRVSPIDNKPFELETAATTVERVVRSPSGQQRFKFGVLKRYGPRCTLCAMDVPELLDAAHIRPRCERGTDDPRNGLVLCALHHRALDAGLFAIHPDTLEVRCRKAGPDAGSLGIAYTTLDHLGTKPHRGALKWFWRKWKSGHRGA